MAGENKLANNRKMTGKNLHNKYERKKKQYGDKNPNILRKSIMAEKKTRERC